MAGKPWITVPLELPINGKTYSVQPLNHAAGLDFQLLLAGDKRSSIKASMPMLEVFKLCLGATWDEMVEDGVPFAASQRAGLAASDYQSALVSGLDSDAAAAIGEKSWETNLDPEALAAAVAAAAKASAETSKPSTSTGTARKTPSRASGRGTTSRQTTPRTGSKAKPVKATGRSTGKRSGPRSGSTGAT